MEELEARAEHELMPVVQACAGVMGNNVSMDQMCWALKVVDELAVVIPPSPGAPPSPHHARRVPRCACWVFHTGFSLV